MEDEKKDEVYKIFTYEELQKIYFNDVIAWEINNLKLRDKFCKWFQIMIEHNQNEGD